MTTFSCNSQSAKNTEWPDSLNTAKDVDYLTDLDKRIIFEMNKVRSNPQAYAEYIKEEKQYYDGLLIRKEGQVPIRTQEGIKALDECIAFLEKAEPVGLLIPNEDVTKASLDHARDLSRTGATGHKGSNGSMPQDRINRYSDRIGIGENLSFGYNEAFEIVCQLLVDDGVPTRGHRDNIMDAEYTVCGVAVDTHPEYNYLCVINYGFVLKPGEFLIND